MDNDEKDMNSVTMRTPWLSVVIPIYNAEKFLRNCLNSILMQTYTNFEVILVDDGSTDGSSDICQEYALKDSRFCCVKKENGGAYQSRIFGAERASGTYITFCDADDFYTSKNVFARLYNETEKNHCSAMQFGYVKKYNHLSRKISLVTVPVELNKDDFLIDEYPKLLCSFWDSSHLTPNVWNKLYHRNLLSNLPSSDSAERIFWGDDQILNLQLLSNCESFQFIPDTLYCYREMSGGTNKFSTQTMKDLDNIKKYQLLYLERYPGESKDTIKKILFSEVAGWFFIYVQQALAQLSENEVITLTNEILQYPSFLLAREYYLVHTEENWKAVNLLRNADAGEYVTSAKACQGKKNLKDIIREILKKIYCSL